MKEKKGNKVTIVILMIIMIGIGTVVGILLADKIYNNEKNSTLNKNTTTASQQEEKYDIEGNLVSFDELGLNLEESFKTNYNVFINDKKSTLTIENKYEITFKDENVTFSKNNLKFYIDNELITTREYTCQLGCQSKVSKIAIFDNKYLALNLVDTTGSNGWLSDIEELHLYNKEGEVKTIKSVSYIGSSTDAGWEKDDKYNTDIYIDGEYIYYYADENNTTERTDNMKIYKYRTTINDNVEKLDFMFNFDATTGEIK